MDGSILNRDHSHAGQCSADKINLTSIKILVCVERIRFIITYWKLLFYLVNYILRVFVTET